MGWGVIVLLVSAMGIALTAGLGVVVVIPAACLLLEPAPIAALLLRFGRPGLVWWPTRLSMFVWRSFLERTRRELEAGKPA